MDERAGQDPESGTVATTPFPGADQLPHRPEGVVADWDTLFAALLASFPKLTSTRREGAASEGVRQWTLGLLGKEFDLTVQVSDSADTFSTPMNPANFGGVASKAPLGEGTTVERGSDGGNMFGFTWTYRNVYVDLSSWQVDGTRPRELRALADAIQRFVAGHGVKNLATFLPEMTLVHPLPKRLALGTKLVVPIRTSRIEERDLSVLGVPKLGEGLLSAGMGELSFAPNQVGTFSIRLRMQNRRTLLASDIHGDIEIVRSLDQEPSAAISTLLGPLVVDDADPLRLRLAPAPPGHDAFSVRVVPLGPKRFLLMQYKRPPSAAPDDIATRLDGVFLVDPPAKPKRLDPKGFPSERTFPANLGACRFVLGDEDWAVSTDESPGAQARARALLEASHMTIP